MRRTIVLATVSLVLVTGLFVASFGSSPAAQAMSWFDSMVTMHHGDHGMHHGDPDMHRDGHCIDDEGDMMHRHHDSQMHRGMMGQMHQMMGNQHADCPMNNDSNDTD